MKPIDVEITNFCCIKRMKQPLVDQGLVYVVGKNLDTEAADSNGSGKSTFFKAISWCWYGETIDGDKGDEVIKRGEKAADVRSRIADAQNRIWTVVRTRSKGKPDFSLLDPDGIPLALGKVELQQHVESLIGLDFQAFKNSVLYGQNDISRFAHPRTKDKARKEILHRILRTGILQQCHEWVKGQHRTVKRVIDEIQQKITTTKARQDEHNVKLLRKSVAEWEEARGLNIANRKLRAEQLLKEAKHTRERAERLPVLRTKLEALETRIDTANEAVQKANELDVKIEAANAKYLSASNHKIAVETDMGNSKEKLDQLEGEQCPLCTSPLDVGNAAKYIERSQIEYSLLANDLAVWKDKCDNHSETKRSLQGQQRALRVEGQELQELQKKHVILKTEIATIGGLLERITHLKVEIKESMEEIQRVVDEDNPHEAQLKAAEKKVAQYDRELKQLDTQLAEKSDEAAHIQFWVRGFSNQGLPSFILDSVMPFITDRANYYLETLADGDIVMEFKTQRDLKSQAGQVRDEIDIRWTIEGLDDVTPSGGQLKKMEIATDLALMDLVASREDGHVDLILFDEIFDGLDRQGQDRALRLLQDIRSRRGTVFVISHKDDFANLFEKTVKAVKENGSTCWEEEIAA